MMNLIAHILIAVLTMVSVATYISVFKPIYKPLASFALKYGKTIILILFLYYIVFITLFALVDRVVPIAVDDTSVSEEMVVIAGRSFQSANEIRKNIKENKFKNTKDLFKETGLTDTKLALQPVDFNAIAIVEIEDFHRYDEIVKIRQS